MKYFLKSTLLLLILNHFKVSTSVKGPFTEDFRKWLNNNGYSEYDFPKLMFGTSGSYGGKITTNETIQNIPIIFIHGNSDSALNAGTSTTTGWSKNIEYFISNGYKSGELYALTWGDRDPLTASLKVHDCETVIRLRKFIEAVLNYTKSPKINIISHSMGVTLGRKAIQGGILLEYLGTSCDIGKSINDKIDIFIGISGANLGLCNCEGYSSTISPTCNPINGLYPGNFCGLNVAVCGINPLPFPCSSVIYSNFLTTLNNNLTPEASTIFSLWSKNDDIIMYFDYVWGKPTSLIPNSIKKVVYGLTHMETKENTLDIQYQMITKREID
ncbi:Lipase EstA/Esterase EstB family-containing protein [Strongyloides ratti]|uniref:Lipase EstA/Esterase EstB family-containing protein n=1 Tax=Strongyloides ratti TaxID=34506 RepID=A0A090LG97_STRRB|nr:Lipase EstA/Esterase EstB family-containing protein [Strongyloides ratti]CEF68816.1 Lipase EstA/Esterase EstB family-containing protein [Strongyloides ratti]